VITAPPAFGGYLFLVSTPCFAFTPPMQLAVIFKRHPLFLRERPSSSVPFPATPRPVVKLVLSTLSARSPVRLYSFPSPRSCKAFPHHLPTFPRISGPLSYSRLTGFHVRAYSRSHRTALVRLLSHPVKIFCPSVTPLCPPKKVLFL